METINSECMRGEGCSRPLAMADASLLPEDRVRCSGPFYCLNKTTSPSLQYVKQMVESSSIPTKLLNLRAQRKVSIGVISSTASLAFHSSLAPVLSSKRVLLPDYFIPNEDDIIVARDVQKRHYNGPNNSVPFEILLHKVLPDFIKASPRGRGKLIDDILRSLTKCGARFVGKCDDFGRWHIVDYKEAREFTMSELTLAAREILTSLKFCQDKGTTQPVRAQSADRAPNSKDKLIKARALQVKFKRPKNCPLAKSTSSSQLLRLPATSIITLGENNMKEKM
jgi:hypothetical protein